VKVHTVESSKEGITFQVKSPALKS
jgi:hypothetical protein